jgi:protein TonB
MTPERVVGIGFVGVLHVIAISAIIAGLGQTIIRAIEPSPIVVSFPKPKTLPPPTPEKPPEFKLPTTSPVDTVPLPKFTIDDDTPRIAVPPTPVQAPPDRTPIADSAVSGIANSHTIPPYPMAAIRMNEEGRVLLHLTVSADGSVSSATVTQSSGFGDLDQSAVAWVLAHWKYRPAIRGGVTMASATDAVVVFSLKNAH